MAHPRVRPTPLLGGAYACSARISSITKTGKPGAGDSGFQYPRLISPFRLAKPLLVVVSAACLLLPVQPLVDHPAFGVRCGHLGVLHGDLDNADVHGAAR